MPGESLVSNERTPARFRWWVREGTDAGAECYAGTAGKGRAQMEDGMFGLDPYHVLLAGCGLAIIAAYWLPQVVRGREPAASGLLILGGFAVFGFLPGMPEAFSPIERPKLWELISEFAVIVALFGTGLRIDRVANFSVWRPATGLLLVGMPLTIVAMALLGLAAGLGLAAAILVGAVLAPTDPVLAADVQVGPPLEGGEHPVRFALTSEAGMNDGLAFPFVYLGILVAAGEFALGEWLGIYVLYKIVVGALGGVAAGWLLGKIMFAIPRGNAIANTGSGVVALAGVMFTYGLCELSEGLRFYRRLRHGAGAEARGGGARVPPPAAQFQRVGRTCDDGDPACPAGRNAAGTLAGADLGAGADRARADLSRAAGGGHAVADRIAA